MKFYIEGTNKWVEVIMRKWNGYGYSEDFSADFFIDFKDEAEYSEEEISAVLELCVEYCDEYDCYMFVDEGENV